jgi:thiamine biosynthesis lipoprotein
VIATARSEFAVWGTTAVVVVAEPSCLAEADRVLRAEIQAVEMACSRFRADSELSVLNGSGGARVAVSPLFLEALEVALGAADATGGLVSPTVGRALQLVGYDRDFPLVPREGDPLVISALPVPAWELIEVDRRAATVRLPAGTQLDFGATAKAWCADRSAGRIHRETGCGVLVSLGGDLSVHGGSPVGGWVVQLAERHDAPLDAGEPRVSIVSGGIATSTSTVRAWRRGGVTMHHIIDPRTGLPARSVWRTVTVAAGTCVAANVASCASMILGDDAADWLATRGLPARLVAADGRVHPVAGWPGDPPGERTPAGQPVAVGG